MGGAPIRLYVAFPKMLPTAQATEMSMDVFISTIVRYSFSVMLTSPHLHQMEDFPSDIVLVVVKILLWKAEADGIPVTAEPL